MPALEAEARKQFYVPRTTKVPSIECSTAFNLLTDIEKKWVKPERLFSTDSFSFFVLPDHRYVHHWTQASWFGGLITVLQTSPESPAIFVLLQNLFRHNSLEELQGIAKKSCGFSDDDWQSVKFYAAVSFLHFKMQAFQPTNQSINRWKYSCLWFLC